MGDIERGQVGSDFNPKCKTRKNDPKLNRAFSLYSDYYITRETDGMAEKGVYHPDNAKPKLAKVILNLIPESTSRSNYVFRIVLTLVSFDRFHAYPLFN